MLEIKLNSKDNEPEVDLVVEVPGRGMADDVAAIIRLFDHGVIPELLRHPVEAK